MTAEYIIDPHEMRLRESDYVGIATIEVGLYDPDTGDRLLMPNGRDHLVLPVMLDIIDSK